MMAHRTSSRSPIVVSFSGATFYVNNVDYLAHLVRELGLKSLVDGSSASSTTCSLDSVKTLPTAGSTDATLFDIFDVRCDGDTQIDRTLPTSQCSGINSGTQTTFRDDAHVQLVSCGVQCCASRSVTCDAFTQVPHEELVVPVAHLVSSSTQTDEAVISLVDTERLIDAKVQCINGQHAELSAQILSFRDGQLVKDNLLKEMEEELATLVQFCLSKGYDLSDFDRNADYVAGRVVWSDEVPADELIVPSLDTGDPVDEDKDLVVLPPKVSDKEFSKKQLRKVHRQSRVRAS
eukprot:TRINITY_DN58253_c0_g1_i1.p1 TRINITY_DN58253_c0_g1~~TRINITY_DN58253_c0_g1_i1.p1  ORF type:complete len:291 (-),score=41.87 TRINITY_DN58253_c0_g1_i1:252-1124(-)